MRNRLHLALLIVFILAPISINAGEYMRLSDKLLEAEKKMSIVYKDISKSLNFTKKRELRTAQYTWKLAKDETCSKIQIDKVQMKCNYKKVLRRTKQLQTNYFQVKKNEQIKVNNKSIYAYSD